MMVNGIYITGVADIIENLKNGNMENTKLFMTYSMKIL